MLITQGKAREAAGEMTKRGGTHSRAKAKVLDGVLRPRLPQKNGGGGAAASLEACPHPTSREKIFGSL